MTDPKAAATTPDMLGGLPMRPTGSGVADLEVAYEQMRLAEDANLPGTLKDAAVADEIEPS